jgi:outer membrane protein
MFLKEIWRKEWLMSVGKMWKTLTVCAVCVLWMCGSVGSSFAAEMKSARISLQDVFKNSTRVKGAEDDMRKIQVEAEAKIGPLRDAITKLHEQLNSGKDTLKPPDKEKLDTELKDKTQELQQEQQGMQVKLNIKQKTLQNVIIGQIREIINKLGKEEGYTVIFNSQNLLYSEGIPDITPKVTQQLDAMPAMEKTAE